MDVDRNKDKEAVFRRFLETFEKRVRSFRIHHISWIDDEYLVTPFERLKIEHRKQLAYLGNFDLTRVFLNSDRHDVGMRAGLDLAAAWTVIAEIIRCAGQRTIQRLRDH